MGAVVLTELHEVGSENGSAGSLKSLKSAPCMGAVVPLNSLKLAPCMGAVVD